MRNDPRFVSAEPFVFCVGAAQRTSAVPPLQLQVSVKFVLAFVQSGDAAEVDHAPMLTLGEAHRASPVSKYFPARKRQFTLMRF